MRNTAEIAPDAPAHDLTWLDRVVKDAELVGLGESTHGLSEQFQVKHRLVRWMVEHHGIRTVAFEDDFASGVLIDRYLTAGQGDPRTLVDRMASPLWGTEEILDLITWLRAWNQSHADQVRFLGTNLLQLRDLGFDDVTCYVSVHAPDRLSDLQSDLADLRPPTEQDAFSWYRGLEPAERDALILERCLGERYVPIGTWFGSGAVSSPGWNTPPRGPHPPTSPSPRTRTARSHRTPQPIGAPIPGMIEAALARGPPRHLRGRPTKPGAGHGAFGLLAHHLDAEQTRSWIEPCLTNPEFARMPSASSSPSTPTSSVRCRHGCRTSTYPCGWCGAWPSFVDADNPPPRRDPLWERS